MRIQSPNSSFAQVLAPNPSPAQQETDEKPDTFKPATPGAGTTTPAIPPVEAPTTESKIATILKQAGISKLTVDVPTEAVAAQATFAGNRVSFEKAFGQAVESFLTDADDIESPRSLFGDEFENGDAKLKEYLNDPASKISLVQADERMDGASWYPAEHGESVEKNWIFALRIPGFSDHLFWAIIPRNGEAPYNYGFN